MAGPGETRGFAGGEGRAKRTLMTPMDLTQFGHCLAKCQNQLVTDLWKKQRQTQELLVKGLCNVLKKSAQGAPALFITGSASKPVTMTWRSSSRPSKPLLWQRDGLDSSG